MCGLDEAECGWARIGVSSVGGAVATAVTSLCALWLFMCPNLPGRDVAPAVWKVLPAMSDWSDQSDGFDLSYWAFPQNTSAW